MTLFSSAMTLPAGTMTQKASRVRVWTLNADTSSGNVAPFWGMDDASSVIDDASSVAAGTSNAIDDAFNASDDAFFDIAAAVEQQRSVRSCTAGAPGGIGDAGYGIDGVPTIKTSGAP
jgi:hypothetical protein